MTVLLCPLTEDKREAFLTLSISDEEMNHSQLGSMIEIWSDIKDDKGRVGLTIYNDEQMVGMVDYSYHPETSSYHIRHFLIDENYRRRGYGTSALRLLINDLRQKPDCKSITVSYMSFNDSDAINLYKRLGFKEDPTDDDEYGERFAELLCE